MKRDPSKISFKESTIESVDGAVHRWIEEEMDIRVETNEGFRKVPVVWSSAERTFQVKHRKDLRDAEGTLIYPMISVERTGIKNNREVIGDASRFMDRQGGRDILIATPIQQDKTSNFANADSKRKFGVLNSPKKRKGKIVYQKRTIPLPVYLDVTYQIVLRSEFQIHMNQMLAPLINRPGLVKEYQLWGDEGQLYEGFIKDEFKIENTVSRLGDSERIFETTLDLKVVAFTIGSDVNQEEPKSPKRENPVELKLPRDRFKFDKTGRE